MKDLLRKCYKEAGIVGVNAPLFENRTNAIQSILDDLDFFDDAEWILLTKWAVGAAPDSSVEELLTDLEEIFCETDNKYSNENTKELHILVEFLLFQYCKKTNNILLPSIVVCSDGIDWKLRSRQLYTQFLTYDNEVRVALRQLGSPAFADVESGLTPLREMVSSLTFEDGDENKGVITDDIIEQIADILKAVDLRLDNLRKWNRKLDFALSVQREESNILWWMLTEWSETCQKSYCDMSGEEAAVFSAYELCENVSFSLGPYASKQILSKMVSLGEVKLHEKTPVTAQIDCLDGALLPSFENYEITDMQPLLCALRSKKTASKKGNDSAWKQYYEIDGKNLDNVSLTTVDFARQLYLELELGRQIRAGNGGTHNG